MRFRGWPRGADECQWCVGVNRDCFSCFRWLLQSPNSNVKAKDHCDFEWAVQRTYRELCCVSCVLRLFFCCAKVSSVIRPRMQRTDAITRVMRNCSLFRCPIFDLRYSTFDVRLLHCEERYTFIHSQRPCGHRYVDIRCALRANHPSFAILRAPEANFRDRVR